MTGMAARREQVFIFIYRLTMIKAIIIDDEPSAAKVIRALAAPFADDIHICCDCLNIDEAVQAINKYDPDIIFLDIELSDGSGFEILDKVPGIKARVIFVTAYDNYALPAIKHNAYDYILKPVIAGELHQVLSKVINDIATVNRQNDNTILLDYLKRNALTKIAISDRNGLQYYSVNDIVLIEGEGSYSKMYLTNSTTVVVTRLIKDFESSLADKTFLRVHKSYLVNMTHITALKREDNGYLIMSNGMKIPISSKDKDHIMAELKAYSRFV
jgi:two-component system, LytTR family, response regulator